MTRWASRSNLRTPPSRFASTCAKSTLASNSSRGTARVDPSSLTIVKCDAFSSLESPASFLATGQPFGPGTSTRFDQDMLFSTYQIPKTAMPQRSSVQNHFFFLECSLMHGKDCGENERTRNRLDVR